LIIPATPETGGIDVNLIAEHVQQSSSQDFYFFGCVIFLERARFPCGRGPLHGQ
jgi:hypothetical protein